MVAQARLLSALAATTTKITPRCDYFANAERCINPQVTASATIPFTPLLHTPPKFVYAVDELDEDDIAAARKRNSYAIPSTYLGTVLKAAFWLEYDQNSLNDARDQERVYYTFVLETSSTNPIGGDQGGCTSLLGEKCLRNLKQLIAKKTYNAPEDYGYEGGLGTQILNLWRDSPAEELGCPADIFGTRWDAPNTDMPILLQPFMPFARFADDFAVALPSGNSSHVHGIPEFRFRSLEEQSARGVVGITVGWPAFAMGQKRDYPLSEVTVETVCLRLGSSDNSDADGLTN
ncbi:hypothetical protein B0T16DRAFT_423595 [Cercophora newfieldiana]|uniref:Uncharacterized protein n=1 Tax=Cercophora newfieldiana TaxID=92897 RepID=A0AA40CJS5_9PEZI|nr:hypothetical protein B0T16DRAFT_423595 [Cercophora newfieldiana]